MKTTPISPIEAIELKKSRLPDEVIQTVNILIVDKLNLTTKSAMILQDDLIGALAIKCDIARTTVVDRGWLNIENYYRGVGWTVTYNPYACPVHFLFEIKDQP